VEKFILKTTRHLLDFAAYVKLMVPNKLVENKKLYSLFQNYLICGGYLRAINDFAENGTISPATYSTYEQWLRGDILKQGKSEEYLLNLLRALITVGVSQISYSSLTQKIGLISKDTCIDYCKLLERMDVLINLQAYDQNKKQGFPRKDRKFHFVDPFIQNTIANWLIKEGYLNSVEFNSGLVEACVASHCQRTGKTFYFKGQGEIDVIWLRNNNVYAIEVKWSNQLRASDLKMLQLFTNSLILGKSTTAGNINDIQSVPVYQFLNQIHDY
jgi:predicted AAA+ superfamily ATPase